MANKYIFNGNAVRFEPSEDTKNYIQCKINLFSTNENYLDKEKSLEFYKEILDRIQDDIINGDYDLGDLPNIVDTIDLKTILSQYCGLINIMGKIVFAVFNKPCNQITGMDGGFNGAFNTTDIMMYAYKELRRKYETMSHQQQNGEQVDDSPIYGANYSFAAMIEEEIKIHLKRYYSRKLLNQLQQEVDNGTHHLNDEESQLIDYLLVFYELKTVRDYHKQFESISATGKKQFDLMNKYLTIQFEQGLKSLFYGNATLGKIIQADYFSSIADSRFLAFLQMVFLPVQFGGLNTRNNLAHGNLEYINYHHLGITCVLFYLTLTLSEENYYNNGITL